MVIYYYLVAGAILTMTYFSVSGETDAVDLRYDPEIEGEGVRRGGISGGT